ncbi:hypothetical protein [Spirillospora sp. NPDC047279]|uniref:hypothetical protein n=1 Tax=Spirillospora sp. NPDC047279 TaxID=3155478 RepID=UPI0033E34A6C
MSYFDDLARHLRERGVSAAEIEGTVADLTAYAEESGTDPDEEFGPAADFAARLTAGRGGATGATGVPGEPGEPGPDAETWRFHTDAFHEVVLLNRFGDQGWELEGFDMKSGFTLSRDLARPQRWEYHREMAPGFRRKAVAERLAPEGWELALAWTVWMYFKRPRSASLGPAGELDAAPEAPGRRFFYSRRFYAFIVVYVLAIAALIAGWIVIADDDGTAIGFLVGAVLGGLALVLPGLRRRR